MMHGLQPAGAALIAVLADRFVLDRCFGRRCMPTMLDRTFPEAGIVPVLLTGGAAAAWVIAALVLNPLRAAYCYAPVLVAVILLLATGGEAVLERWRPFEMLNRVFGRAAVISSMLGLLVIVPAAGHHAVSFSQSAAAGILTGTVFVIISLLYSGIREKAGLTCQTRLTGTGRGSEAFAKELVAAGLLALVLAGVLNLNLSG